MTNTPPSASLWYAVHSRTSCTGPRGAGGLYWGGPDSQPFFDEIIFGLGNEIDYGFFRWLPGLTADCKVDPSVVVAEISLTGSAFDAVTRWPKLFAELAALADPDRSVDAFCSILEANGFVHASP